MTRSHTPELLQDLYQKLGGSHFVPKHWKDYTNAVKVFPQGSRSARAKVRLRALKPLCVYVWVAAILISRLKCGTIILANLVAHKNCLRLA